MLPTKKNVTKANPCVLALGTSRGPEGAQAPGPPQGPQRGHWVPTPPGGALGCLGPEALRAGGLGKHGLALLGAILTSTG